MLFQRATDTGGAATKDERAVGRRLRGRGFRKRAIREKGRISELARFAATGILNTATDLAVLDLLLASFARFGFQGAFAYALAKSTSFSVAVAQSFWLNKSWVFRAGESGRSRAEAPRFAAISLVGLGINVAVASSAFAAFSALSLGATAKADAAAIVGTLVVLAWNYVGYRYFVFSKSRSPQKTRPPQNYERLHRPVGHHTRIQ